MIEKLLKLLKIRFAGELTLKDGTPIIVSGDLAIGVEVKVNGPDGVIPLPAGSYELESGQIITVDDKGVITDIVEQVENPESPDEEAPTVEVDEAKPTEEEVPVEEKPVEEVPVEDPMKKMDEMIAKIAELEAKIKELESKTSNLSEETNRFNSELETIKNRTSFTKELPKNSTPDVVITSNPKVEQINKFRQLKNQSK